MHVFLTGAVQSGKSTAVARYLAGRREAPAGFLTRWDRSAGVLELEVLDGRAPRTLAAARMAGGRPVPERAAFDLAGERLLALAGRSRPLLVMDELGFLEACSPRFQEGVFALLDGPAPVVGVLRPHPRSPFWGPLSRRGDVTLLPLTPENREAVPGLLARLLDGGEEAAP